MVKSKTRGPGMLGSHKELLAGACHWWGRTETDNSKSHRMAKEGMGSIVVKEQSPEFGILLGRRA